VSSRCSTPVTTSPSWSRPASNPTTIDALSPVPPAEVVMQGRRRTACSRLSTAWRRRASRASISQRRHAIVSRRDTRPPAKTCPRDVGVRLGDNCRRPGFTEAFDRPDDRRVGPDAVDESKLTTARTRARSPAEWSERVPFHKCQVHHIEYWENGGRTDLDNQVPLCSRHHHAAHEGGWTLSLDPETRALGFQTPIAGPPDYRCRRDSRPVGSPGPDRRTRP
jgi:hypothetical protein